MICRGWNLFRVNRVAPKSFVRELQISLAQFSLADFKHASGLAKSFLLLLLLSTRTKYLVSFYKGLCVLGFGISVLIQTYPGNWTKMALINTFSLILDIAILVSPSIFMLKFKIEMLARYVRCLEKLWQSELLTF